MNQEHVNAAVDGLDQPDLLGQAMDHADPAHADGLRLLGQFAVDVLCGEHRACHRFRRHLVPNAARCGAWFSPDVVVYSPSLEILLVCGVWSCFHIL
jgi:hypothetical protein